MCKGIRTAKKSMGLGWSHCTYLHNKHIATHVKIMQQKCHTKGKQDWSISIEFPYPIFIHNVCLKRTSCKLHIYNKSIKNIKLGVYILKIIIIKNLLMREFF